MKEAHVTVTRTARYYISGEPSPATREIWFVCHGYAQLARFFARSFASIETAERIIVVPEALNRYYYEAEPGVHTADARVSATWMTKEDREYEIADYVAYLDTLHAQVLAEYGDVTTVALGFSQGSATVSRWVALGRARIDHVVLWGGSVAPEIAVSPSTLRGASLILAVGASDPFLTAERMDREQARLRDGGLHHVLIQYEGGHSIERDGLDRTVDLISARDLS